MEEFLYQIYFTKGYITHGMEFTAALAGSLYLFFNRNPSRSIKWFVWFLWSILIIDLLGNYAGLAYHSNYEYLGFIENTPFVRNNWYFNIATIYFNLAYLYFIRKQLISVKFRKWLKWVMVLYLAFVIPNLFISEEFFSKFILSNFLAGTFLILAAVLIYFYDTLLSEQLLYFYRNLFFYVALGVCIHSLITMPIYIYHGYLNLDNPNYIQFFRAGIMYANIMMYSLFALGFFMEWFYKDRVVLTEKSYL
ncbi:hypothetical protein [Gramella sp. AN32]|uniref:Histidine kinase N-terminal 7TM region domain-containing protein n=1 Tax=Christiangramia antarctica TaxID=2058158 RepID=A0ABW5X0Q4_9FLAO|nr:hypothetical protein [Gramella sp. AN32]MCM4155603.1 hypothetical protein [Gramella sp. AN32]